VVTLSLTGAVTVSGQCGGMDEHSNEPTTSAVDQELADERGRDRRHQRPGRVNRIYLRLDDEEHARVLAAATGAGMTAAGFCAEAALGAVETGQIQGVEAGREELRAAMIELFAARRAVNRFGTNVNQAVTVLHSTGEAPVWLTDAVRLCTRAVAALDAVTARISRCLPLHRQRLWRR